MKKLLLALVLVCSMVGATAPFDGMYNTCVNQMKQGSCVALADPGSFTPEQLATPVFLGREKVTWAEFLAVRGIGSVDPTDFRMCEAARQFCLANEEDGRCKVGKALWGN
jgi:hypothetical protein